MSSKNITLSFQKVYIILQVSNRVMLDCKMKRKSFCCIRIFYIKNYVLNISFAKSFTPNKVKTAYMNIKFYMNIEIYRIPMYEFTKYLFNAKITEVNEPMDIMCSKFCAYIHHLFIFANCTRNEMRNRSIPKKKYRKGKMSICKLL